MIDFTPQITQFLKDNFRPSAPDEECLKLSSSQILGLLFNVFPNDCIDEYDLNDIMSKMKYKPYKINDQVVDDITEEEKEVIKVVWCLKELSNTSI